jgi:4-coumarate--CoA ligase
LEAKIVSSDGEELPIDEPGEMWLRGPNVFPGYLNNPAGTKNALTEDGWFKTGDVAYRDKDGFFFITDRIKELIKYNAYQVAPAELEGLLMSHPKVSDVAVVGVKDDSLAMEVPRAYVVTVAGVARNDATAIDIMKWLEERVANHKRLRGGIRYLDSIPKTASGKILRGPLRTMANTEGIRLKARL